MSTRAESTFKPGNNIRWGSTKALANRGGFREVKKFHLLAGVIMAGKYLPYP